MFARASGCGMRRWPGCGSTAPPRLPTTVTCTARDRGGSPSPTRRGTSSVCCARRPNSTPTLDDVGPQELRRQPARRPQPILEEAPEVGGLLAVPYGDRPVGQGRDRVGTSLRTDT